MDFFEALSARRSVRKYKTTQMPADAVRKCLNAALLAPNSSNMQTWEFYWVRDSEKKKALATACLGQPAATTAAELIVAVARTDTWRRNRDWMLAELGKNPKLPAKALDYYKKLIPFVYTLGPLGILGPVKFLILSLAGLFKPVPRGPFNRKELDLIQVKSCALACENIMLAASAQGYGSCPMEGFDEWRVKKILGLPMCKSRVVMVISLGETDEAGVWGDRIRFDPKQFIFEV